MLALDVVNAVIHVLAVCDFEEHDLVCHEVFHDDAVAVVHVVRYRFWGKRIGATEVTPIGIRPHSH